MFDLLKKKLDGFLSNFSKEETAQPEPEKKPRKKPRKKEAGVVSKGEKKIKRNVLSIATEHILGKYKVKLKEIEAFLEELEFGLLESDVSIQTSEHIIEELKNRLVGREIEKGSLKKVVVNELQNIIVEILNNAKSDLDLFSIDKKPLVVVVLGPNGAGKTTTIAKLIHGFKSKNKKILVAAADTFRAAAVEQLKHHCDNLGVELIYRDYGADPTSVAYDGYNKAKSKSYDVLIIDTAGRQDTNINLINQLEKMKRVIKPDYVLYVGESISGSNLIEQVKKFDSVIGIDGLILTKLDCDTKGGSILSLAFELDKPILYLGVGQGYDDLIAFDPSVVAEMIIDEEDNP